jgi:hypothetical protein
VSKIQCPRDDKNGQNDRLHEAGSRLFNQLRRQDSRLDPPQMAAHRRPRRVHPRSLPNSNPSAHAPHPLMADCGQQLGHINSLKRFLTSMRQAYMQIGSSHIHPRNSTQSGSIQALNGQEIVSLTDTQRDEIDFEAKSIIRQTMDRIRTMENFENGRTAELTVLTLFRPSE